MTNRSPYNIIRGIALGIIPTLTIAVGIVAAGL